MAKRTIRMEERPAVDFFERLKKMLRWWENLRGQGGIEIVGATINYRGRKGTGNVSGPAAQQLRYKSMQDDHIVCRSWNGTTEGDTDILVAKPYYLRLSPFDGTTNASGWLLTYINGQARTASKSGETDVSQSIDPPYAVNDLIYAIAPSGGTAVTVSASPDDINVSLLDLNADARRWAYDC